MSKPQRNRKVRFFKKTSYGNNSQRDWDSFRKEMEGVAREAMARAAIIVETEAKLLLNLAAYPPASAPGDPPHKRTGTLGRSIQNEVLKDEKELVGRVGTNLVYGRWLELGTSQMEPRPYLRPALTKSMRRIKPLLRKVAKANE
jgi:HK97 gp10 family phage protein